MASQHQKRIEEAALLTVSVIADTIHLQASGVFRGALCEKVSCVHSTFQHINHLRPQVGALHWSLTPDVLVLKSARCTYTLAVSGGDTFYLVRLPDGQLSRPELVLAEVLFLQQFCNGL